MSDVFDVITIGRCGVDFYPTEHGSYVELVIAGSKTELPMAREQILAPALDELARFFPKVRSAAVPPTSRSPRPGWANDVPS